MDVYESPDANLVTDERAQIEAFVADNRREVVELLDGLTEEQARRRPVSVTIRADVSAPVDPETPVEETPAVEEPETTEETPSAEAQAEASTKETQD